MVTPKSKTTGICEEQISRTVVLNVDSQNLLHLATQVPLRVGMIEVHDSSVCLLNKMLTDKHQLLNLETMSRQLSERRCLGEALKARLAIGGARLQEYNNAGACRLILLLPVLRRPVRAPLWSFVAALCMLLFIFTQQMSQTRYPV